MQNLKLAKRDSLEKWKKILWEEIDYRGSTYGSAAPCGFCNEYSLLGEYFCEKCPINQIEPKQDGDSCSHIYHLPMTIPNIMAILVYIHGF